MSIYINRKQAGKPRHDWSCEKNPVTKVTGNRSFRFCSVAFLRRLCPPETLFLLVYGVLSSCNHQDNGKSRDNLDKTVKGLVRKTLDDAQADAGSQAQKGEHQQVQPEAFKRNVMPDKNLKGKLQEIYDHEKPGVRTDKFHLLFAHGKQINCHDRPCGVADHGDKAAQKTEKGGEPPGVCPPVLTSRELAPQHNQKYGQQRDAEEETEIRGGNLVINPDGDKKAGYRGGEQPYDCFPVCFFSEIANGYYVRHT